MKKSGGDSVIFQKGSKRSKYMMDMGVSMDVKPSPSYNKWYEKVDGHDNAKLKANKNKLEEQY